MRFSATLAMVFWMISSAILPANDPAVVPQGPSFRVETEVFAGDSIQPAARHLILFDSGVIYDIRLDDDRIATMYDPARRRVILVDRLNREQVVLSTEELLTATARARAAIEQEGRAEYFGLLSQVSELEKDEPGDPQRYQIAFGDTTYTTTTIAVRKPQIAAAYNHFATLASQLNVSRQIGLPPFARMTLGQYIADMGQLPLATTLELKLKRGVKPQRFRSQLQVVEQLSLVDRERIAEFGRVLADCKPIDLADFQL